MAVACRCAEGAFGPAADPRARTLLEVGKRYAGRAATRSEVEWALRAADAACAVASRKAGAAVWGLFEGLRAAEAAAQERATRALTAAVRWALGLPGGEAPAVPAAWSAVREAVGASGDPPACPPTWRTADVVALARLVRDGGDTGVLPILADALQDAGCDDDRVLGHCRDDARHSAACWVPDLVLDAD
jgi:hypothetical protein